MMRRRRWAESTTRTTPPESCYRLTVISKASGESSPATTGWGTLCYCIKARSLHNALRCVAFALTLVGVQHNVRMDSDPILAFLCVVFLSWIVKKLLIIINIYFAFRNINATLGEQHQG